MSLPVVTLTTEAGVPSGAYVPADTARQLESTLSRLVWHVLYGKSLDASGLAAQAEEYLSTLKAAA
jgi:hypothetical protein